MFSVQSCFALDSAILSSRFFFFFLFVSFNLPEVYYDSTACSFSHAFGCFVFRSIPFFFLSQTGGSPEKLLVMSVLVNEVCLSLIIRSTPTVHLVS